MGMIKSFKRLPKRNRRIFMVMGTLPIIAVASVVYLVSPDPPKKGVPQNLTDAKARTLAANAARTADGEYNISKDYLKDKKIKEDKLKQEAKDRGGSYMAPIRHQLQSKYDKDGNVVRYDKEGNVISLDNTSSSPSPELVLKTDECVTDEGIGIKLDDGSCIMPNGNVYNKKGYRVTERFNGSGKSSYSGSKEENEGIYNSALALFKETEAKEAKRLNVTVSSAAEQNNGGGERFIQKGADKPSDPLLADAALYSGVARGFKPGDAISGVNRNELSSDAPNIVRIDIPSGPLKGGYFTGTVTPVGDYLDITITYLSYKSHFAKVSGKVIDARTNLAALQSEVDRHIFSRIMASIGYGFAKSGKELVVRQGSTTTNATSTVTSRPAPTANDMALAGLGYSVELAQDPIKKYISRPNTIKYYAGEVVAVYFTKPQKVAWLTDEMMAYLEKGGLYGE